VGKKDKATKYYNEQEISDISFVKIGEGSKNLVVTFTSAAAGGFERMGSLFKLKYDENVDVDMLYLRDMNYFLHGRGRSRKQKLIGRWYLGGLKGIGENIDDTISFLRKQIKNYKNVIFAGCSMGGYASILFGSILSVNHVLAWNPQTDLDYILENVWKDRHATLPLLKKRKKHCPETWEKYSNLKPYMNNSVNYWVSHLEDSVYIGNAFLKGQFGMIMHSSHHLNNISECETLKISEDVSTKCPFKQASESYGVLESFLI
jgi:hypothetical protein